MSEVKTAVIMGFAMSTAQVAFGQAVQWTLADGGNGHYYQVVAVPAPISWTDAQAKAIAAGGYLATLTSSEENDFVYSVAITEPNAWHEWPANFHQGPWLGGSQVPGSAEPAGGWEWVTGEPFGYTRWNSGEPNDFGEGEDRLHLHALEAQVVGGWNDAADSGFSSQCGCQLIHGYIVEYEAVPVPTVSEWGLVAMSILVVGVGCTGIVLRQQRVT